MILLDTNLLVRVTNSTDLQCACARQAIHQLLSRGSQVIVVPQVLYEFWVVATRNAGATPRGQNGLGMSTDQANQWLAFFQRRFTVLPDRADLLGRWQLLVRTNAVRGYRAHDARLVAAMETYGIATLMTFNGGDFRAFGISIIDPRDGL